MIVKIRNLIRLIVINIKYIILTKFYGMHIHKEARIAFGARLDKTYPDGIFIDSGTYVGSGTLILAHDFCRDIHTETKIGKNCFIGMNSIILPGLEIEDQSIVGAGSVVTKDVPPNTVVAGNPAKIIKQNIKLDKYGKIISDE